MALPARRPRPQHVLTVESTDRLGPHLVRIVFTGDSLADFGAAEFTDAYVKLIFVDPALGLEPPTTWLRCARVCPRTSSRSPGRTRSARSIVRPAS
ncbi:siderophore-interacting protein [Janibacter cremeus]|uniref:siderophore-interacting protein n=1 Tax=Janibacter cremeus TaxID=1285192 RepID=UPI003D657CC0